MPTPNPRDERVARPPRDAYPAERARQGRIVLKDPVARAIFIAALIAFVLLAVVWLLAF